MKDIYIYGIGKGKSILDKCLCWGNIRIKAYIDNYSNMSELNDIPIIRSNEMVYDVEKVIITLMDPSDVKKTLIEKGISQNKIVCFFSFEDVNVPQNWEYIDEYKWKTELMWKYNMETVVPTLENLAYEINANEYAEKHIIPEIISAEDTVDLIKKNALCLSRFGDGEFEIMLGRNRANFQSTNGLLRERLIEVLKSKENNLLVAIADNYGSLSKYTKSAANGIRQYLGNGKREEHMGLLDMTRKYYDAYLSRPYMIYRDKSCAKEKFERIKEIWDKKAVLVVEGVHTRFGVGNDLLGNASSINRILTLDKDCFSVYDKLLDVVKKHGKDKLILVILGPVATVMAHDLAKMDYWAVDIGQLDVEYEWFLRGVKTRCDIPYKTVSEITQYGGIETKEESEYIKKYRLEIIDKVV